jgi:glycosyltransferase involved in cell wall biosynthesis
LTVFISIPWFLPAFRAGGPIQSIANLVSNIQDGTQFKIFCGSSDLNGEALQNITANKWVKYNDHTEVFYATKNDLTKKIKQQIVFTKPDALFIIGIFSWHFNVIPLLFASIKRKILSVRGMLHKGALSQKKNKKRIFLSLIKLLGIQHKIIFHATDAQETSFVKNVFGDKVKIIEASNFGKVIDPAQPLLKEVNALKLITVALISPMKNHLLILEALQKCTGNITYNIYGAVKDTVYWEQCLAKIKLLPQNIVVKYHGELDPAILENALAENHVFIMTSKSENFAHAISESLSAAKPVITSHGTPWNNLKENNAGFNVDTNRDEIATAINFFVSMNNETYHGFVEGSKKYVTEKNNLAQKLTDYKNLFSTN